MTYVVPVAVIVLLLLFFFHIIPTGGSEQWFANAWRGLLIFILAIKPISLMIKRYLTPTYWKLPEGMSYLMKGWTQEPILKYIRNLIVNVVYSICLYGLKLRKRLGILVFRLIFLHRSILEVSSYQAGAGRMFLRGNRFIQTGVAGLAALVIGAITSNMFSIRLFQRRWKLIQRIAYIAFLGACLHLFFLEYERSYLITFIIFVVLKTWERWPRKTPASTPQAKTTTAIPDGIKARIINRKLVAQDVLELTLDVREQLKIMPGQRALLTLHDKDWYFNRSYSLVDYDIDENSSLFVLIIKLSWGRGTSLLANTKIGDELLLKGIYGKFVLQETDLPKIFIATGVWIAPLLNMAKHCGSKQKKLYFSVPNAQELFYEDRIKELHDVSYEIHITREELDGYKFGRLDVSKAGIDPSSEIYVCGNPKVVEEIIKDLQVIWCKNIFSEKF